MLKTIKMANGLFLACPHCGKAMAKGMGGKGYWWMCVFCGTTTEEGNKMNHVEIYFSDLTAEAQQMVLKAAGIASAEEGNFDTFPLVTLDYDVKPEEEGEVHGKVTGTSTRNNSTSGW